MIRNLKALGLALVAVCAMSAMTAAAAQAAGAPDFTAAEYPAHIEATKDGTVKQVFTSSILGAKVRCENVGGTAVLENRSNELTATNLAFFENCLAAGVFPTTVNTNSCHFLFTVETTVTATESTGKVHLKCTEEPKSITITIFRVGAPTPHVAADRRCTIHIPAEQTFNGVTYRNIVTGNGVMHVTVEANVKEGIEATYVPENGGIPGCEKEATTKKDSFEGAFIASATNELGEPDNLTIEDTP